MKLTESHNREVAFEFSEQEVTDALVALVKASGKLNAYQADMPTGTKLDVSSVTLVFSYCVVSERAPSDPGPKPFTFHHFVVHRKGLPPSKRWECANTRAEAKHRLQLDQPDALDVVFVRSSSVHPRDEPGVPLPQAPTAVDDGCLWFGMRGYDEQHRDVVNRWVYAKNVHEASVKLIGAYGRVTGVNHIKTSTVLPPAEDGEVLQ